MSRILLIEDDQSLAQSISKYLASEGFPVDLASTLSTASEKLKASAPDLLILDWMLPDGQGIDFLRSFRASGHATPVILLTAKADVIDKVLGLETGANDYLVKPFEPRELIARIRVQLRTHGKNSQAAAKICAGPITIDPSTREATVQGRAIELTRMEFELLRLLCESPNRVYTRDELLNKVWGYQNFPTTRTVDTHILQLRTKCGEELFETVRGVGYRLKI